MMQQQYNPHAKKRMKSFAKKRNPKTLKPFFFRVVDIGRDYFIHLKGRQIKSSLPDKNSHYTKSISETTNDLLLENLIPYHTQY